MIDIAVSSAGRGRARRSGRRAPPVIVADEPTAHLDGIQVEGVLSLIREIAEAGPLVVVATHDNRITRLADRVSDLVQHSTEVRGGPRSLHFDEGKVIFRQGDTSDVVYVVASGTVEIYRERADGPEEAVTEKEPGRYFGELGPLLDLPRAASARAKTDVELTAYPFDDFRARYSSSVR
jgi:putative ABC transport system ATP-binding protein